jgi:hypothetical protein
MAIDLLTDYAITGLPFSHSYGNGANQYTGDLPNLQNVKCTMTGFDPAEGFDVTKRAIEGNTHGGYLQTDIDWSLTAANSHTIWMWVKYKDTGAGQFLASAYDGAANNEYFYIGADDTLQGNFGNGYIGSTTKVVDGNTYLLAIVKNGTDYKLWLNNAEPSYQYEVAYGDGTKAISTKLSIMGAAAQAPAGFKSQLLAFGVINAALSDAQLQAIYAAGVSLGYVANNSGRTLTATPTGILYNANGGEGGAVPALSEYIGGATATVKANTGMLYKLSKYFSGWNTAADGSGTARAPAATYSQPYAQTVLYAQYTDAVAAPLPLYKIRPEFRGVEDAYYNGWPKLHRTADGTLWAFFRGGYGGESTHYANATTAGIIRKSSDNGKTWGADIVLFPCDGTKFGGHSAIGSKMISGVERLFCIGIYETYTSTFQQKLTYLDNTDGNWAGSWSAYVNVGAAGHYNQSKILVTSSGNLVTLWNWDTPKKVGLSWSDANGATWTDLDIATDATYWPNEGTLEELPNGKIRCWFRDAGRPVYPYYDVEADFSAVSAVQMSTIPQVFNSSPNSFRLADGTYCYLVSAGKDYPFGVDAVYTSPDATTWTKRVLWNNYGKTNIMLDAATAVDNKDGTITVAGGTNLIGSSEMYCCPNVDFRVKSATKTLVYSSRTGGLNATTHKDTMIYVGASYKAYTSLSEMYAIADTVSGLNAYPIIRFDISGIPAGYKVSKATLSLVVKTASANSLHVSVSKLINHWGVSDTVEGVTSPTTIEVDGEPTYWFRSATSDSTGTKWKDKNSSDITRFTPDINGQALLAASDQAVYDLVYVTGAAESVVELDVTELYRGVIENGEANTGMVLRVPKYLVGQLWPDSSLSFYTRNNAGADLEKAPQLTLEMYDPNGRRHRGLGLANLGLGFK